MASPGPALAAPPPARTEELHLLLVRLRAAPDEADLSRLYDLTAPVVHGWASAGTSDRGGAASITVAVYTHLWRHAGRYCLVDRPWRWLEAAWLFALRQHRADGIAQPGGVP